MKKRANKGLKVFNQAVKVGVNFVGKKALKLFGIKRKYKTPRMLDTAKMILRDMFMDIPEARESIIKYVEKHKKVIAWLINEKDLEAIYGGGQDGQSATKNP